MTQQRFQAWPTAWDIFVIPLLPRVIIYQFPCLVVKINPTNKKNCGPFKIYAAEDNKRCSQRDREKKIEQSNPQQIVLTKKTIYLYKSLPWRHKKVFHDGQVHRIMILQLNKDSLLFGLFHIFGLSNFRFEIKKAEIVQIMSHLVVQQRQSTNRWKNSKV